MAYYCHPDRGGDNLLMSRLNNLFDLLETVQKAEQSGASDPDAIAKQVVERLKSKDLDFAVEDPDAPESWPRVWFIWRGNALMSSSKGHEYFLKHYLGTHHNDIAEPLAKDHVKEVAWLEHAPTGKMDLVVDLNFRMDTSALYSDVVLPAATWYEKDDLNSTDLHTFINPMQAAVPPAFWASAITCRVSVVLPESIWAEIPILRRFAGFMVQVRVSYV